MGIIELMQEHANLVENIKQEQLREKQIERKIFDYNKLSFIPLAKIICNLLTLKEGRLFEFAIEYNDHQRYDVIIRDVTPNSKESFNFGYYITETITEKEHNREVVLPTLYNETKAPKKVFETRYTTAFSDSEFEMYPYINDFIKFLIEYKVQNNRNDTLSYDEMNILMHEFLKLQQEMGLKNSSIKESTLARRKK